MTVRAVSPDTNNYHTDSIHPALLELASFKESRDVLIYIEGKGREQSCECVLFRVALQGPQLCDCELFLLYIEHARYVTGYHAWVSPYTCTSYVA